MPVVNVVSFISLAQYYIAVAIVELACKFDVLEHWGEVLNAVDFKRELTAASQKGMCFLFQLLYVGVNFLVVQH